MFGTLGKNVYALRWFGIAAGVLVLLTGICYGIKVFGNLMPGGLDDPASPSAIEASRSLSDFPGSRVSIILLARSAAMSVDDPRFESKFLSIVSKVENDPAKPVVETYYDNNVESFVSKDRHATFALIGFAGDQGEAYERVEREIGKPSGSLSVSLGGSAVADYEVSQQIQFEIQKFDLISLPILAILLLVIFRSPIAALLPLVIGAISVLGAFSLIRLLTHVTDISVFAANIISLLGLGLAIDYSLLLVSRYREEVVLGADTREAVAIGVKTAGESIFLSGTTVGLSLLGLLVFPQMFLRSMGIGGAVAVFVAMIASLTVLPSILSVLGNKLELLAVRPNKKLASKSAVSVWRTVGEFIVRRPAAVLTLGLAVLLIAGIPFLHVRFSNPGATNLPPGLSARTVAETITNDFSTSQSPSIEVLMTLPQPVLTSAGVNTLNSYDNELSALPNVCGVTSVLTYSHGLPLDDFAAVLLDFQGNSQIKELISHYVDGNSALLKVDYPGDTNDPATQRLVYAIRSAPVPAGAQVLVGGDTATLLDRMSSLGQHLPFALGIMFFATFLVLLLMLRSVLIPVKAILLNTLSLSAAFGLMTWIFQDGHLHKLLGFTPCGSLYPTLPILIFAIAFGLATDYEVFLVSRIKEEYYKTGDNTGAIVAGLEKTGGIITSAGLLLIVVVAVTSLTDILSMKEMGVGLTIAVIVDAAIVRALLVPAAMQLFGKLNWWLPGQPKPDKPALTGV